MKLKKDKLDYESGFNPNSDQARTGLFSRKPKLDFSFDLDNEILTYSNCSDSKNKIDEIDYETRYFITYVLLKIQNGDWKIDESIASEKTLANKLDMAKSKCHFLLNYFQNAKILHSVPFKSWVVQDYLSNGSVLSFCHHFDQPFDFRISISQKWLQDPVDLEFDDQIFCSLLQPETDFDINNLFCCKKVFYANKASLKSCVQKIGIVRPHFFNWDVELIRNDILKFLAVNGHAVFRRVRKIILCNHKSKFQECDAIIEIFELIYNQKNELVMVIKESHTRFSTINNLIFNEGVY
ncbi:hypothetical protein [Mycoplasmoides fastidiosum]|nr:hypothetical protein [Mycoplasmoides fastidiosum]UUD37384.1 hypothetical protein NPA10_02255 [Mycoplasmoides fastidiosum]